MRHNSRAEEVLARLSREGLSSNLDIYRTLRRTMMTPLSPPLPLSPFKSRPSSVNRSTPRHWAFREDKLRVASNSKLSRKHKDFLSDSSRWGSDLNKASTEDSSDAYIKALSPTKQLEPVSPVLRVLHEFKLQRHIAPSELNNLSEVTKFGQGLQVLSCTDDLEINYSIARGYAEVPTASKTHIGTFLNLSESLEEVTNMTYANDIQASDLAEIFLRQNRFTRDFLISLRAKDCQDEAVLLELFWRVVVKFMDNAFSMHFRKIAENCEDTQHATRTKVEALLKELLTQQSEFNKASAKYQDEIDTLQSKLKGVKLKSHEFEELLISRNSKLAQLTDISRRDRSVAEFNYLMERLSDLITETESSSNRRLQDLYKMSEVFHTMQAVNIKLDILEQQVQTDWTYHSTVFNLPCFKAALPSNHLFARACGASYLSSSNPEALVKLCEEALDGSDLSTSFAVDVAKLICKRRDKPHAIAADLKLLVETLHTLADQGDTAASLYGALIGLKEDCPKEAFTLVGRIFRIFAPYGQEVPILVVHDSLESIFANEHSFAEEVMASLAWTAEDSAEFAMDTVLKLRLTASLEACHSSLDSFLEAVGKHTQQITKKAFTKSAIGLPLLIKDSELSKLFDLSFPQGGVPVSVARETLAVSVAAVRTTRNSIALAVLTHWRVRYLAYVTATYHSPPKSFNEFFFVTDYVQNHNFECALKAFLEIHCLDEEAGKVLQRHNLLSTSLLEVQEPTVPRRGRGHTVKS
jgi:hypothetical protein